VRCQTYYICGTTRREIQNGEEIKAISEEIIREIREQTIRAQSRGPVRAQSRGPIRAKGDRPIHAKGSGLVSPEAQADARALWVDHSHRAGERRPARDQGMGR
jgi:hypothetical protein